MQPGHGRRCESRAGLERRGTASGTGSRPKDQLCFRLPGEAIPFGNSLRGRRMTNMKTISTSKQPYPGSATT